MLVLLLEVGDIVLEGRFGDVKCKVCCLTAGLFEGSKEMLDLASVTAKPYLLVDLSSLSSCTKY